MSFFGTAIVLLLNTSPGDWSVFDWTIGLVAIVVLYAAGITASIFVEKLLQRQTSSREDQPPIEPNGAQA